MLRYPIGQQDFAYIRENNFLYIDKTGLVFDLVNGSKYVFLTRPRRFGKSLLLSTIKAYFEGRKDLFKGLAVESLEKDWIKHPVFHLALSRVENGSHSSLRSVLHQQFSAWEQDYGIINKDENFSSRFSTLIQQAYKQTGFRVVILIDEYDNPLINTLNNDEALEKNRNLLKSVYSNLKDQDAYIRFGMLAGVSRFSKMSMFSGLNNLFDITFSNRFCSICGITKEEALQNLQPGVEDLAHENEYSVEEAWHELAKWYDGYHFSEKCPDIYNPFSLLNALNNSKIYDYWFETATPEFLVKRLSIDSQSFSKIFHHKALEKTLAASDISFPSPVALLYQTGYLTIKDYDRNQRLYLLDVPNKEVENSLFPYLITYYTHQTLEDVTFEAARMRSCLENKEIERFMEILQSFLASVPYDLIPIANEKYFQNSLYLLFRSMPLKVEGEQRTSHGRADLVVTTEKYIYVIELKTDSSASEALNQIEEKKYYLPYLNQHRDVICLGINFSSKTRNITDWLTLSLP